MSETFANMPLLNQLALLLVGAAYFIGIGVFSYKRGGALTLWSFVIGAGALIALNLFGDKIIQFINAGVAFTLQFWGGGDPDSAQDLIIPCDGTNQGTCNEAGFLFLLWLLIVLVGHLLIYCVYRCFGKNLSSKPTPWAFFVGLANAWLYGFILLPPLAALFGVEFAVAPFTDSLLDSLIAFATSIWALIESVFSGVWDMLGLEPWLGFLLLVILVLIIAATSITRGKKASSGSSSA